MTDSAAETAERIATRQVYAGRLLRVDEDRVRLPNGKEIALEMVRHPGAAAVVPLLSALDHPDPQVLMLRQYRYATTGTIWEIPAGVLEPGESPEDCARRELREETGASADQFDFLTTIYTTPGFTDEQIHLFVATGIRAGEAAPEVDEQLEVVPLPMSRVLQMIQEGEIVDGKSIVALLFLAGFRLNR
ncbi:MAG TPA: NUDIX hydrolase [Gemmatimonadales bacterium]